MLLTSIHNCLWNQLEVESLFPNDCTAIFIVNNQNPKTFLRDNKILKENHKNHRLCDFFKFNCPTLAEVYPQQNLIRVLSSSSNTSVIILWSADWEQNPWNTVQLIKDITDLTNYFSIPILHISKYYIYTNITYIQLLPIFNYYIYSKLHISHYYI